MAIVEKGEDALIKLAGFLLLLLLVALVVMFVIGPAKFFQKLADLLGIDVSKIADWFGRLSSKLAIDNPVGTWFNQMDLALQNLNPAGASDQGGAQVYTHSESGVDPTADTSPGDSGTAGDNLSNYDSYDQGGGGG